MLILIASIFLIFLDINKNKKNNLISEKYVQAGIYLASGNDKDAKILLDEIILAKNRNNTQF